MRRPREIIFLLAFTMVACDASKPQAPVLKPSPGGSPPPKPADVGTPAIPASTPTTNASVAMAGLALRPPAVSATKLKGRVMMEAPYALSAGGARLGVLGSNRLLGMGGATVIGQNGAGVIGQNGAGVIGQNGAGVIGQNGAGVIGQNGAGVIGQNGAGVIGQNGAGLIADGRVVATPGATFVVPAELAPRAATLLLRDGSAAGIAAKPAYRLAQTDAAPAIGESLPAAGAWLSVVDMRTGLTVQLGTDGKDPVYTVYTGLDGEFEVHVPPEVAPYARIVARAPGLADPRLVLQVLSSDREAERRIDEDRAAVSAQLRFTAAARLASLLDATTSDVDRVLAQMARRGGETDPAAMALAEQLRPGVTELLAAVQAGGAPRMCPAQRLDFALHLVDRVLVEIAPEKAALTPPTETPVDPGWRSLLPPPPAGQAEPPAVDAMAAFFKRLSAATAAAAKASGQPIAAYFAAKPYLVEANLRRARAGEEPAEIRRAADMAEFVVREYLAANDDGQFRKIDEVVHDLGMAPGERDVVRAAGTGLGFRFLIAALIGDEGRPALYGEMAKLARVVGPLIAGATCPPTPATAGAAAPTPPRPFAVDVTTVAGKAPPERGEGDLDGPAGSARFNLPSGIAVDPARPTDVYVAEAGTHLIRRVRFGAGGAAEVSTVAGLRHGDAFADGVGAAARFYQPRGLAFDPKGRLLVADEANHRVRRITFDAAGQADVKTLAGDGNPGALNHPWAVTAAPDGAVYVADKGADRIVELREGADGRVASKVIAGPGTRGVLQGPAEKAWITQPRGVAAADGGVYVLTGEPGSLRFLKPGAGGAWTAHLVTGGQAFSGPRDGYWLGGWLRTVEGLAVDPITGGLLACDTHNHAVRLATKAPVAGAEVGVAWLSTLAGGEVAAEGFADGDGATARFRRPGAVAVAPDGTIYVADTSNHAIRRLARRP